MFWWLLPCIPTQMIIIYVQEFMYCIYIYIITRPAKQKPAFSWTTRRPLSLEPTKTKVVLGSLLWAPWLQLIQTEKKNLIFMEQQSFQSLVISVSIFISNLLLLMSYVLVFHIFSLLCIVWHLKCQSTMLNCYVLGLLRNCIMYPVFLTKPRIRQCVIRKEAIPHFIQVSHRVTV